MGLARELRDQKAEQVRQAAERLQAMLRRDAPRVCRQILVDGRLCDVVWDGTLNP